MAKAAFLYLEGEDQETQLASVLAASWPWLAADAGKSGSETETHQEVRAILESPEAVEFRWLDTPEEVKGWPIGRAFGTSGELTWRREDGLTHIVLVTEREDMPPSFTTAPASSTAETAPLPLSPVMDKSLPDEVRLWGERKEDGTWREARIPGPLVYPLRGLGGGRRVTLKVRCYVVAGQRNTGLIDFVRYVDLTS